MFFPSTLPSGRGVLVLDALLAVWAAAWIAVGVAVAGTFDDLVVLPNTFGSVGAAIDSSGRAIGSLELPVVGNPLEAPGREISDAGREVARNGRSGRDEVERSATLLGLAVALVPTLPLLVAYLPSRVGREREAHALRLALAEGAGDPALERFLAHRAAMSLSYRRLHRMGARPWRDLDAGRHELLAAEELRRLGVARWRLGQGQAGQRRT